MKKKDFCCKEMKDMIKFEDIEFNQKINNYQIYGKPELSYHYRENITEKFDINYCPFCGKKLKET